MEEEREERRGRTEKGQEDERREQRQSGRLKWQMFTIPELYELC